MSTSSYIKKVAFVGAGGRSGSFMVNALLKTGKHTITALSRAESKNTFPEGVQVATIDYSNPTTLIDALRGQDALVITMSTAAPKDQEMSLIKAAAEAGVAFVLPNEWGPDTANEGVVADVGLFQHRVDIRKAIEELGTIPYISVATGFWYEWSLGIKDSYGFDFENRKVTFFDEGETRISTSTWPQVGRAVAAILSLPIRAEGGGNSGAACLDHFRNQLVYINSFTVSQKEMFESVLRVTGSKAAEWDITREASAERLEAAGKAMSNGDRTGYVRVMYTRVFYPDGNGNFERSKGTLNGILGLPQENIDEATTVAVQRAGSNPWS